MNRKTYIRSFLIVVVLLIASSFYYLPYYVSKPGMAKDLEPLVEVEGGDDASGNFMLTTVRMGKANIYSYAMAKFNKYHEIYPEAEIRGEGETDKEFNVRQLHLMDGSKNNAIQIAYEKAGKPISFEYLGVYVLNVLKGMPADGKLQPGDQIIEVDDLKFQSSKQFIDYVGGKKAGDTVTLVYKRESETETVVLKLKQFEEDNKKVGIGISLDDDKKVITDPAISMDTDQIGGPSAGLMFTLEIYNQLTKGDITKGYQIAGTGTMSEDGTVGPIGGIQQKIVAADKAGADIFFAPNENGAERSNYRQALIAAKDIKTDMEIVPVDTVDDALKYLDKLK
ncbi:SepM family pheromone-processing serine protease [Bacillus sp. V59.32b]|uniref:SepM family pheromone-processing serine protease n=1 Tax=Bacillus sp. V59.32b TaxID=1758642 RepID=UPI000E3D8AE2|nr:SepM family pheromone-processing serine protease [Bacillus sp. V59.32b]RFU60328.1 PDZ domain-containing protein [Bacillus sp. V59.32b]